MATTSHAEAERQQSVEEQIHHLKQQLAEAHSENGRNRQRLEKLGLIVLERDKKINELQQYEYSFRKINEQRHAVGTSEETLREQLRVLQSDKERLCKELEDSQQHTTQLERVIRFLRERQEESQLEINQFHDEFHKAQAVIAEFTEKFQSTSHSQQELEEIIAQERQAKEEALEEVTALYSQFEALKKMLMDAKMSSEGIQAEREEVEAAHEKLRQDEIDKAHASRIEAEAHLKLAQQHLAKKVKETSDLHDKVHAQDVLIQGLQTNLEQMKMRLSEQQHSFESQLQQEKRIYEQLCESVKATESLVSKWEEKYFNVFEKWQDNEMHLKEMKKIEVKHNQLQVLLANIGGFFGTPMNYSAQTSEELPKSLEVQNYITSSVTTPADQLEASEVMADSDVLQNKSQVVETSNMKKPYHNLFDMPVQNKRPKHNLFE